MRDQRVWTVHRVGTYSGRGVSEQAHPSREMAEAHALLGRANDYYRNDWYVSHWNGQAFDIIRLVD